jgi:hypothetical protein
MRAAQTKISTAQTGSNVAQTIGIKKFAHFHFGGAASSWPPQLKKSINFWCVPAQTKISTAQTSSNAAQTMTKI